MNESTLGENPVIDEAFAAYVQAQENGKAEAARTILRENPGLAEEVAMFYALCARVPQPWDSSVNSYDGRTIGDFELLHELGRGGEGVVYKARQKSLQRVVAVKVMRLERFSQDRDVERFRRDSTLLASLHHPNIVQIFYAGESETGPYFAMELMADGSLKQKLADGWLPTPHQAAGLTRVLAEAMRYAHDNGIVHRDLKPANILLQADGTPKIVDFGLAKKLDAGDSMTQSGAIVGTASYMSPEQAKGQPADFACDIYGLGAILYELLTGRPPFVGATLVETLEQVRHQDPLPVHQFCPNVPRDLEAICLKCLEKVPTRRYVSAEELGADLQRFFRDDLHDPVQARLPGITEQAFRVLLRQQFHNVTVWGRILLVTGILGGICYVGHALFIAFELPPGMLISLMLIHNLLVAVVYWLTLRGYTLKDGDRQALTFTIATIVGSNLIPVFYRPPEGMDLTTYRLSLYPLVALVHGLLLFAQGPIFWGGFYVYGACYVLLAFVMLLCPGWSPVLLGLFTTATLILLGLYLLRLGRSPDFEKR